MNILSFGIVMTEFLSYFLFIIIILNSASRPASMPIAARPRRAHSAARSRVSNVNEAVRALATSALSSDGTGGVLAAVGGSETVEPPQGAGLLGLNRRARGTGPLGVRGTVDLRRQYLETLAAQQQSQRSPVTSRRARSPMSSRKLKALASDPKVCDCFIRLFV